MFWWHTTNLGSHLLQFSLQFPCLWMNRLFLSRLEVMYEQKKREKPLRHRLPLMIFDHSRIPRATHLLRLCCQDVMSRGSISFNYSHFSSIYTSAASSLLCKRNLCFWEFIDKMCFFFVSFFLQYKVLCVHKAIPHHYFSLSMLLYQTMTSAGNCFQTRQGPSFHFFIFRFIAQVSVTPESSRSRSWGTVHDVM